MLDNNLHEALRALQDRLAIVDMLSRPSRGNDLELLLKKLEPIRLTMDGDNRHPRPHIHLDYGKSKHSATFAIDNGKRIEGNVPVKYDAAIESWILNNQTTLLEVWKGMRAGGDYSPLVTQLLGSDMDLKART